MRSPSATPLRRLPPLCALLIATAWAATALGQAPATVVTVYEGARVIVGDGRAPIENAAFVVSGNRITDVGRAGQVRVPAGATRVSLAGKTVMPAIIDTHTHLSQTLEMLTSELKLRAHYGVGAAQSLGVDTADVAFEVRANPIPGAARVFTAGRGITMPEPGRSPIPYWVNTEAEARKAVKELAVKKVDIVKIWVDDRLGTVKKMPPELYQAVIDEAHKNNLRTIAHIYTLEDAKGLLRAGIDAFAHGVRDKVLDDEAVELYKGRHNLVVGANMPPRGVAVDMSWLSESVPPAELQKLQAAVSTHRAEVHEFWKIQAQNLAKLNAAGVKIVVGTDGNSPYAPHIEMEDMVAAGMTATQVITAATKNGAEFLRMTDSGTIEANKTADFLVLDANPLDDITNTRKISAVYLKGASIDRAPFRVSHTQ